MRISIAFILIASFIFSLAWAEDMDYIEARKNMVEQQIRNRGVHDQKVLDVMLKVKRHLFVPMESRRSAYNDHPLPIGHNQTISQPYIVALMTALADLKETDKVLEIGTGSGYQAAVLAELAKEVYTIEIIAELAERAESLLNELGYTNIKVRHGDGYKGWPEHAPFDAIIVTAAPPEIPQELINELAEGGRMVLPVGVHDNQVLKLLIKKHGEIVEKNVIPVKFVPMVKE